MAEPIVTRTVVREWSPRARLYGMALVITLSYMLIARLSNDNDSWVQVSLPLSSASLLLVSLAAAEAYLYVQRVQRDQDTLRASRAREIELSQRLAFQRQSTLNQISRALIDKLDLARISAGVLEKIAQLFEADAIAVWLTEKNEQTRFLLKGIFGFTVHKFEQLEAVDWAFHAFEASTNDASPLVVTNLQQQAPALRARLGIVKLTPVSKDLRSLQSELPQFTPQ